MGLRAEALFLLHSTFPRRLHLQIFLPKDKVGSVVSFCLPEKRLVFEHPHPAGKELASSLWGWALQGHLPGIGPSREIHWIFVHTLGLGHSGHCRLGTPGLGSGVSCGDGLWKQSQLQDSESTLRMLCLAEGLRALCNSLCRLWWTYADFFRGLPCQLGIFQGLPTFQDWVGHSSSDTDGFLPRGHFSLAKDCFSVTAPIQGFLFTGKKRMVFPTLPIGTGCCILPPFPTHPPRS